MGFFVDSKTKILFPHFYYQASINIDYSPSKNVICRIKGRWLNNKNDFLGSRITPSRDNYIIATSISLKLSKTRLNNFDKKTSF